MIRKMTLPADEAVKVAKNYGAEFLAAVEAAIEGGLQALTFTATEGDSGWDVKITEPSGIMVALMIPAHLRDLLAVPGGEHPGDLHITLNYLGEAAAMSLNDQRRLIGLVGEVALRTNKLTGRLKGTGRFVNGEDTDPYWVGVDIPGIMELQSDLHKTLTEAGFAPHADFGDYRPHVTVAYLPADVEDPAVTFHPVDVEFCELTVCIGGQRLELGLQKPEEDYPSSPAYGWSPEVITKAIETDEEQRFTLAPWYIPDMLDAHGEWTDKPEIERTFHKYLAREDRDIRLQHDTSIVAGRWVSGMVVPHPYTVPLKKSDGTETSHTFPAGTPFLGVHWEKWAWDLIKAGKFRGYSIGGSSKRMLADLPDAE
jgi:2'-5' RNA ligase